MKKIIFRIEKDGIGPYFHPNTTKGSELYRELHNHETFIELGLQKEDTMRLEKLGYIPPVVWSHPRVGPFQDPYLRDWWIKNYHVYLQYKLGLFGCSDLKQLNEWFIPSILSILKKENYKIAKYKCNSVIHGLRQSIGLFPFEKIEEKEI
jgi:hypothetical protein